MRGSIAHLGEIIGFRLIYLFQGRYIPDLYDPLLAHVVGWELYNLHDLVRLSWVGSVLRYTDPAQPLTTAGKEMDDIDHDLSDLSVRSR